MPAIYHVKVVDDSFDGAVQHIIEAKPNDAVVWHCEEADASFDGAIFHVKWAAANFDGPVWRVLGIARAITVVIKGTSPLTLPDAVANSLSYVKAFGGTEQRNIPQPYTQVNYVTNTAQTAVDTGIMIDFAKNYEFEVECRAVSGSWYILQSRASASGNITGIHGATSGSTITLVVGNVTVCTSAITRTVGNKLYVKATLNAGTATLYVKDETANTEDTQTGSYGTSQPNPTAAVYLLGNAGGQYVDVNSDIYMARIKENDTVVMDYVPARQVATAGFYDTVSGTFKTAETPANLSADGNTVPTPDAPMDIVSNNGVLKARHQSGLPLGYTLLDYIESTRTQYIDTGVYISTGYKVRVKAYATSVPTTTAFFGCTSDANSSDAKKGINRLIGGTINRCAWGNGSGTVVGNLVGNDSINTWYDMVCDNGVWTINDTLFATCPESSFTSEYSMWLFARNTGGTVGLPASCRISVCQIWDNNGQMIRNLVPCKNASNVVGMFDTVSQTFFTNAGTGDFVAGSTVSDPVEIYADGTVETINVHGKNLFDKDLPVVVGKYISDNGTIAIDATSMYTDYYISIKPSTTYTLSWKGDWADTGNVRIHSYTEDKTWISMVNKTSFVVKQGTFITPANARYLRVSGKYFDTDDYQLELGSTATAYEPYYDGGTATAEMLLKVGDYQDVQSIIDGVVTRNVGVKVLDGTENWYTDTLTGTIYYALRIQTLPENIYDVLSTHFAPKQTTQITDNYCYTQSTTRILRIRGTAYETSDAFKQFLADQYAASTPVIIVYPLATPTTESVTGQTLQVTDGDNVLEITQASLNGLELEAQYQAAVSLTIQEVQDANLDPNVEVTIN